MKTEHTKKRSGEKPAKPFEDFPLFPHASGRWAKKINGSFAYFGKWDEGWEKALERYEAEKVDLYAGRKPERDPGTPTVSDLCNRFLNAKRGRMEDGHLTVRSFRSYRDTADRLVTFLGRTKALKGLTPADFATLYTGISRKKRGPRTADNVRTPASIANEITRVKVILKFAYDERLVASPIHTGTTFVRPSQKVLRRAKRERGPMMFEAGEIRQLIDAADPQLKAMILLGINCGFGNHDCASLPESGVNLKKGWIDHARPKTEIHRRAPLWPETVAALKSAQDSIPEKREPNAEGLFFVTAYGRRWVRSTEGIRSKTGSWIDSIGMMFGRLVDEVGIPRKGFYCLRHTFATIAAKALDPQAAEFLMGHVPTDIGAQYRESIDDDRLEAVVKVVRDWLYSKPTKGPKRKAK